MNLIFKSFDCVILHSTIYSFCDLNANHFQSILKQWKVSKISCSRISKWHLKSKIRREENSKILSCPLLNSKCCSKQKLTLNQFNGNYFHRLVLWIEKHSMQFYYLLSSLCQKNLTLKIKNDFIESCTYNKYVVRLNLRSYAHTLCINTSNWALIVSCLFVYVCVRHA